MTVDEEKLRQIIAEETTRLADRLESKIDAKADRWQADEVRNMLDECIIRQETDEMEKTTIRSQLDRQSRWIHQLAENTGTELSET